MPEVSNVNSYLIDLGAFTIQAPASWKKIDGQNGNNGKGRIALDQVNAVEFNVGPDVRDISIYRQLDIVDVTITEVVEEDEGETESTRMSQTSETRTSQTVESDVNFDVIDSMEVKILVPQKPGKGVVGVYFARIGVTDNKFNLFGVNLKPENEAAFLAAIRTLKFHNTIK